MSYPSSHQYAAASSYVNGHAKPSPEHANLASRFNNIVSATGGGGFEKDLPMYKDKPSYLQSRRKRLLLGQNKKLVAILSLVLVLSWWTGFFGFFGSSSRTSRTSTGPSAGKGRGSSLLGSSSAELWQERREAVKDAFQISWAGYEKYAWGMDEYHPITRKGKNMVAGGFGWIIVDALDTAMMMNLTDEVSRARDWIRTSLTYTADHDVNTFETTIRMLGGLLSAHYLSTTYPHLAPLKDDDVNQPGEDLYIEKAADLADRLLGAYETASGIPLASINLNTSQGLPAKEGSSTAEAATLQLEMKYLSKLTGEPIYWQRAENIIKVIDDQHKEDGLLPIFIRPDTGHFVGSNIRLGSRGDSYYEYLIKQYIQTRGAEPVYLDMWNEALLGIKKHLITYTTRSSLTVLGERQNGLRGELTPKMDHLICFMPGTIALGLTEGSSVQEAKARMGSDWTPRHDEDLRLAEELMKTCYGMYKVTATGLAPEISYFHIDKPPRTWQGHLDPDWQAPVSDELSDSLAADWRSDYNIHSNDVHNLQRPETVESLYYMYHITGDPKYRDWGWTMFESFRQHTKVVDSSTGQVYAFTSLSSVVENPVKDKRKRDNMESFWLAETLKYFYLLFSDEGSGLPRMEDVVINTEAHFFPRFDIRGSKVWKTGWERSPRLGSASGGTQQPQQAVVGSSSQGVGLGT